MISTAIAEAVTPTPGAEATIDTPETRDQLFEYFVDKGFIGREQIIIASYFHDSAAPIEFEELEEALTSGHRAGEVRTYARKREFDTSPSGGDGGKRTARLSDLRKHTQIKTWGRIGGAQPSRIPRTAERLEITYFYRK